MNRRALIGGAVGVAAITGYGAWRARRNASAALHWMPPAVQSSGMRHREFGRTGLKVSEVGFGSWGIGGKSYGAADRQEALRALARAEELGCNFVDSAKVYGDSEGILGEFLKERRSRWIVATKFSGQDEGMRATLERQLQTLGTDFVDLYQLHWFPRGKDAGLLDELAGLKKAGKTRFVGISLYSAEDIDEVLARPDIDSFQVAFSLLDPDPFMARLAAIHEGGKAVIVRSALREGFLTGKFKRDATFPDPLDQRHKLSAPDIAATVDRVERFRFLEKEAGSMVAAAAGYPLSFTEVATVILGTKTVAQADSNFGEVAGKTLSPAALEAIRETQIDLSLGSRLPRLLRRWGLAP